MNDSETTYVFIPMYNSTMQSWRNDDCLDYTIQHDELEIGILKNGGAKVLLNLTFESVLDDDNSKSLFHKMLRYCAVNELLPGLFVNHETIKYNEHEYKSKMYNLLDVLEEHCINANLNNFLLVDAGMNLSPQKEYRTHFEKYVANIWVETSYSNALMVQDWIQYDRFLKENVGKSHLLSDLRYVKYPVLSFLSRSKLTRLTLYTEAKKQGWWDTNPYLTYKDFNQAGEVESPVNKMLAESPQYINDVQAQKILSEFKDREQLTAPGEFFYDSLTNWPCGIGGVGFPPATRSIQENFFAISAESETRDTNYFITEKTIQPMFNLLPVTILGQIGINTFMEKELGFDMFKDIIDYDNFDHLEDEIDRAKAFAKTIYNSIILNFDDILNEWRSKQSEFNERLYMNYRKMYELKNQMSRHKIIDPAEVVDTPVLEDNHFNLWLRRDAK